MKKQLSFKRNMFRTVLQVIMLFQSVWSGISSIVAAVTGFSDRLTDIDQTAESQQQSLKGYTLNKRIKKRLMADLALSVRGKVNAFAYNTGNTILQGKLRIPFSKMFYMRDNTALANAKLILDLANSDMTPAERTEYNISPANLTALSDAITAFSTLPSPAEMKVIRKQLTAALSEKIRDCSAFLVGTLDGLMQQFRYSNSEFYQQYRFARRIMDSHRHTVIEGETIDSVTGEDLTDVSVLITSSTDHFEEMTDAYGKFRQQISPEINYTVRFSVPGYEPREYENVNLNRGEHERLIVRLTKL